MTPHLSKCKMGFKIHHHYQSVAARSAKAAMAEAAMVRSAMAQSAMAKSAMTLSCIDKFAYCLRNQEYSPCMA